MSLRWVCYHCLKCALTLAQSNLPTLLLKQHVLLNAAVTPEPSAGTASPVSACALVQGCATENMVEIQLWSAPERHCEPGHGPLRKHSSLSSLLFSDINVNTSIHGVLLFLLPFVLFICTLKTFSMKYITIHLCSVQHNGKHSQHD